MAQDLLAQPAWRDAVVTRPGGFYAVNCARLGLPLTTLAAWQACGLLSAILSNPAKTSTLSTEVSVLALKQHQPDIPLNYPVPTRSVGSFEPRVLEGIWAVAPYLHIGSVPTLEDLLKPAAQRPATVLTTRSW